MVGNVSVLVSSFPSATVDGGYDGSYTRRMARSYGSKWDALRDLVEDAGGACCCHDAHPDVEKAMRADGGFRHVSAGA